MLFTHVISKDILFINLMKSQTGQSIKLWRPPIESGFEMTWYVADGNFLTDGKK